MDMNMTVMPTHFIVSVTWLRVSIRLAFQNFSIFIKHKIFLVAINLE